MKNVFFSGIVYSAVSRNNNKNKTKSYLRNGLASLCCGQWAFDISIFATYLALSDENYTIKILSFSPVVVDTSEQFLEYFSNISQHCVGIRNPSISFRLGFPIRYREYK